MKKGVKEAKKIRLKALWHYLYRKMVNEKGSVDYIARGWALGMFIGCVIPMGGQLLISIPLSFVIRGSKIGAVLGTLITNPVTVLFIYPAQCFVGSLLLGGGHSFAELSEKLNGLITNPTWSTLWGLGWRLVASFFMGGLLMAAICTPITYIAVRSAVNRVRTFREHLRQHRNHTLDNKFQK